MADVSILDQAVHAAPKAYLIKGSQEIILKGVTASFDGTGAGSSYVPAVQVIDPSGFIVGTYILGQALAAGASADVSWFPGVGNEGSLTPTTPGAVLDYAEPAAGTLNITATNATTANQWIVGSAISLDGLTRVHVECWVALATTNADVVAELYDNGSDVARIAQLGNPTHGAGNVSVSLWGSTHITPTAGSHQFEIRAWQDAGGWTSSFLNPTPFPFSIFSPSYYQVTVDPTLP